MRIRVFVISEYLENLDNLFLESLITNVYIVPPCSTFFSSSLPSQMPNSFGQCINVQYLVYIVEAIFICKSYTTIVSFKKTLTCKLLKWYRNAYWFRRCASRASFVKGCQYFNFVIFYYRLCMGSMRYFVVLQCPRFLPFLYFPSRLSCNQTLYTAV